MATGRDRGRRSHGTDAAFLCAAPIPARVTVLERARVGRRLGASGGVRAMGATPPSGRSHSRASRAGPGSIVSWRPPRVSRPGACAGADEQAAGSGDLGRGAARDGLPVEWWTRGGAHARAGSRRLPGGVTRRSTARPRPARAEPSPTPRGGWARVEEGGGGPGARRAGPGAVSSAATGARGADVVIGARGVERDVLGGIGARCRSRRARFRCCSPRRSRRAPAVLGAFDRRLSLKQLDDGAT